MKKKWILWLVIPLCVAVLAAAAVFMVLQQNRYTLSMDMEGRPVMAVELGQCFEDPGVQAQGVDRWLGAQSVAVDRTGQVDTNTLGVYRLAYTADFHGKVCTAYRDVHIVESLAPVIQLIGDPDGYTLPNAQYQEEGYTATDWYDGDLTAQVQRTEANGVITYTVTNSAGLSCTVQRSIRYDDPVPPEIVLEGGTELTIQGGKPYQDPGFYAKDNVDGDLTELVTVSGTVDAYRPGVYPVTYTVSDHWGNTTIVTRNVTVEVNFKNPSTASGKIIYLTFDDGPGKYTGQLLDILAKYDAKATFFVVNTGNMGIAQRMVDEGHAVAIHTATHNYASIYASDEAFFADLYRMQEIIAANTGKTTYLMRFPGGSSNSVSINYNKGIMSRLVKSVREKGFYYFDWNVDSNDAGGAKTAQEVFDNVTKGIEGKNTAVVLQHDIYDYSVDAVERIIVWGLANGYVFLPLTEGSPSCAHGTVN